ncbi:PRC-barrel domain-containing protein [Clostridium isatidis]|mgnify:CR=1 FL=1|uniref:Photosystem reaction center subunit H n=1 Tax=Clostridium isatidis TaxID=182773 RepID=A0A343JBV5_9CLOT|nr:PRC-barrel domain-containing protein [Clostridium isatidis]ASW43013.1 photosystem reaction center subunit H [Clostridium isatidis]NLZ35658.1 photosystem reaction center subunit H [Clostridiales bacterium]
MLKTKDFNLLKVYDTRGKYLGIVDDIYINFYKGIVEGLFISNYIFFSKRNFVKASDIISFEEVIIARKLSEKSGVSFKSIKDMEIKDNKNVIKGVLEDLIIEKETLMIKGLIMSSGLFDRIIKGREILLIKNCLLGEDFILHYGNGEIRLKSIPRRKNYDEEG